MTFLKRLCSTVILLGVFACIIFGGKILSQVLFLVFGTFIAFFTPYETCCMLKQSGKNVYPKTTSFFVSALFLTEAVMRIFKIGAYHINISIMISLGFLILPWIFLLFSAGRKDFLEGIMLSYGVFYLLFPAFIMVLGIYERSINLFLFFILGTKIGDIGAYVTGTVTNKLMNGNHKMIPKISPGKSWEGAAGGLIISILFSILMFRIFEFSDSIPKAAAVGAVLFVFGAIGDLAESSLKRSCGVKDSGHTIPGIGGVFDLVDSLMLNAVVFTLLLSCGYYFQFQYVN